MSLNYTPFLAESVAKNLPPVSSDVDVAAAEFTGERRKLNEEGERERGKAI